MRYLTKRRNPIRGHRLGGMSTILETQVATKKLKNLQQRNGGNQNWGALNLFASPPQVERLFVCLCLGSRRWSGSWLPEEEVTIETCVDDDERTQDVFSVLWAAHYSMLMSELLITAPLTLSICSCDVAFEIMLLHLSGFEIWDVWLIKVKLNNK